MSKKVHVGEVRPSQLLWTYGPGALIDLPNLSVVTLGLDYWEEERCKPIDELLRRWRINQRNYHHITNILV